MRSPLFVFSVIAFTFMTLQAALMECAATEMSQTMKQQWFEAVVRQDMAYFDLLDVSGTATIISINGRKFKKYVCLPLHLCVTLHLHPEMESRPAWI